MSEIDMETLPVLELAPEPSLGDLVFTKERGVGWKEIARWLRRRALFICVVVLPVLLSELYLGFIAADQYVSEARYIVRTASSGATIASLASPAALASLQSMVRTTDDTNAVNEYMRSRDAVARLVHDDHLREITSRPEGDFVARFPNFYSKGNAEGIFRHFQRFVDVSMQGGTGISILRITTFRPEDSRDLARALLLHAEELVNTLNSRARQDAIGFAKEVVAKAEERLVQAQQNITAFRDRERTVDPGKQTGADLELISSLNTELVHTRATLAQILALAPNSPQIPSLSERIHALESQIDQQRAAIAGGEHAISFKLSEFERLTLERELAVKSLNSALVSLENAMQDSQRQQLYLEQIVRPNLPDQPLYPRRWLLILLVIAMSVSAYLVIRKFGKAIIEHHL